MSQVLFVVVNMSAYITLKKITYQLLKTVKEGVYILLYVVNTQPAKRTEMRIILVGEMCQMGDRSDK